MLLGAARRIAVSFASIAGGTVVVSLVAGFAAGSSVARSVSVGLYIAGAVLLVGCFVFGVRGPMRGEARSGETVPLLGARRVRRATGEERSDAVQTAILLFALGLGLVILAALVDPVHRAY